MNSILNEYKNLDESLDSIHLISYLLENFQKINEVSDFLNYFQKMVINVTNNEERKNRQIIENHYEDEKNYSFIFKESKDLLGICDLDFIKNQLINIRIQLFGYGILSSMKINKRYQNLYSLINEKYKSPEDDKVFDRLVWKKNTSLVITLRKVKNKVSSISFTATDNKYF